MQAKYTSLASFLRSLGEENQVRMVEEKHFVELVKNFVLNTDTECHNVWRLFFRELNEDELIHALVWLRLVERDSSGSMKASCNLILELYSTCSANMCRTALFMKVTKFPYDQTGMLDASGIREEEFEDFHTLSHVVDEEVTAILGDPRTHFKLEQVTPNLN